MISLSSGESQMILNRLLLTKEILHGRCYPISKMRLYQIKLLCSEFSGEYSLLPVLR